MLQLKLMTVRLIGCTLLAFGVFFAQVPNAVDPARDVYEGFETTTLSKIWDTSRFVPGGVTMQSDIVRAGQGAAKIVVRANDKLDKRQIVDYTGVNAYPEEKQTGFTHPGWFYFKMGLYRDLMDEPMTIYLDEYRKRGLPGTAF